MISEVEAREELLSLGPLNDGFLVHATAVHEMREAHFHTELELNLVTSGTATLLLAGRRFELKRGSMVWLAPRQGHILLNVSPSFGYWLGVFSPDLVESVVQVGGFPVLGNDEGTLCRRLSGTDFGRLSQTFESIGFFPSAPCSRLALPFSLAASWAAYESGHAGMGEQVLHPCVQAAIALLTHTKIEWKLKRLAQEVGVSPSYLSALFRAQTGTTITDFRNLLRLDRYRNNMLRNPSTISEAAIEAGFGSYAQFYRVHKEGLGRTPSLRTTKARVTD
ncbi:MAG: AraC family transcriptional regulator [Fimbriimonas sp.]